MFNSYYWVEIRLYSLVFLKMSIEFKRCSSAAHFPKGAHEGSARYDIWSPEKVILKPWS